MADTLLLELVSPKRLLSEEPVGKRGSRRSMATSECCPATRR